MRHFRSLMVICISFLLGFYFPKAFGQKLDNVKTFGGSTNDYGLKMVVNPSGSIYTIGTFSGTINADPNGVYLLQAVSSRDFFIQKLDGNGNMLWAKNIGGMDSGGYSNVSAHDIATDENEDIFITGHFFDRVDFDPDSSIQMETVGGAFILKLDGKNGAFIWVKIMEEPRHTYGNSIVVDKLGNIYTTGAFCEKTDFDPGIGVFEIEPIKHFDAFIQKMDKNGNFIWAKSLGGDMDCRGTEIKVNENGDIILAGWFNGSVDFDPGPGMRAIQAKGINDQFISMFAHDGSLIWVKTIGATNANMSSRTQIAIDAEDNIVVLSSFAGTIDFNPGSGLHTLTSEGSWLSFLLKLNSNGNVKHVLNLGLQPNMAGMDLTVDRMCNSYVTGFFENEVDFDPGPQIKSLKSTDKSDLYLQKFDLNGRFLQVHHIGGKNDVLPSQIEIDTVGNLFVLGNFNGELNYDANGGIIQDTTVGLFDVFLMRFSDCNTFKVINQQICDGDSAFFANRFFNETGKYFDTLANAANCDSIMVLNLKVNPTYSYNQVYFVCDSFMWHDGILYRSNNHSAKRVLKSSNGCDSTLLLKLTLNYTNSSVDTVFWCKPFVWLNGKRYADPSITDTMLLKNQQGCDSIVHLRIIDQKSNAAQVIWPNPSTGIFHIALDPFSINRIELYNVSGQKLSEWASQTQYQLPSASGIYFVRVFTACGIYTYRIIRT